MEIKSTTRPLLGEILVPGDKSISHRAVMLGSLARGTTKISNFLKGADCLSTINCFQNMGIAIKEDEGCILIEGKGLHGLSAPAAALNVGNSGTTLRLLSGILSVQSFHSQITGDDSIQRRPMRRIITPLSSMGGQICSVCGNDCAPLDITGSPLHGIDYYSPVASAQVKSCVLLAGMYANGSTSVTEPFLSRNHTELMLSYFGAQISAHGTTASIQPEPELEGREVCVPGDISSAAYWIGAALMVPGSELLIKNVGINPTRSGMITACRAMGADITFLNEKLQAGEPVADILVKHSHLKGTVIDGALIPTLIDELPILAMVAAFAQGTTIIRDAQELKVKESDRLSLMVQALTAMGCDVEGTEDGMIINGGRPLHGIRVNSHKDHRIAMTFSVAGLAVDEMDVLDCDCVSISYPDFYQELYRFS